MTRSVSWRILYNTNERPFAQPHTHTIRSIDSALFPYSAPLDSFLFARLECFAARVGADCEATSMRITSRKKHVTYIIMNVCGVFFVAAKLNQRLIARLCLQNTDCVHILTFGGRVPPSARDWTSQHVNAFDQTAQSLFPSIFSSYRSIPFLVIAEIYERTHSPCTRHFSISTDSTGALLIL